MNTVIDVQGLSKTFTLHNQGGMSLKVLDNINFCVEKSTCTVLHGESGAGKSTLLRTLYANYLPTEGAINLQHQGKMVNLVQADSRELMAIRRNTIGYVSQFLRVIPRVSTLDVVKQPLTERGVSDDEAQTRAAQLLTKLNIDQRLWGLAPGTFSGGEQQRVNIARGFIHPYPILLLDEPTASLDRKNSQVVVDLIRQALQQGSTIVGIFHDKDIRETLADQLFSMQ